MVKYLDRLFMRRERERRLRDDAYIWKRIPMTKQNSGNFIIELNAEPSFYPRKNYASKGLSPTFITKLNNNL